MKPVICTNWAVNVALCHIILYNIVVRKVIEWKEYQIHKLKSGYAADVEMSSPVVGYYPDI